MATGSSLTQNHSRSQSEIQGDLHNGAQRINPENRIPAQLACAYLKGHLKGRALDWFEVLGYRVIEDKATDYAHLKKALSEQFPVVRNRSELETRFYSSSQRRDQQPSDFIYELLKIHKILKLKMSEEKLIDHVVSRLEPQILDYVEVRHPQNTANLLQIVDKYEERFMNRQIRGSSEGFRSSNPNENNRFNNRHRQENWRENRNNERYANNSRPQREFNRLENQGFANNWRFEGRRQGGQSDQRFHNQGGRQSGSRNSSFRGQNERTLWETGAEKSFISEEVYRYYFSCRPRQKTKDRVVTAQGDPCSHLGRVELQIRIREFQKPWEFHILDNMQYQCILGIDFMKASRLTLDFDQKSLIIPDNLIKQLPKIEKPVDIDPTDTKLGDGQQRQLKALFNNFKGLFSDQPGLTHVLYHEIDTGDKGPVVSRPYRYDRVKQGIIDYHIDKMLRDGTICPINSPYASPVVLTRKKNDLPPDSPEAYRFAIDYRKLNGITKYPRYPLPVIDDLLTNIPHTGVMSTLDLRSGYFQLAISPKDIEKTAFITRNGTFAFLRMPFGLSGAAPNFQKAIDIILKPVIGRFVLVYMDDVIITSPSFKDHLDHLNQFNLFTDASGVGIGAVLQQNQKPIAFASRTLNKAERNYTVTERECLAVIWALNKFKTYFGPLPVKVITDHAALTKLTNGKNLSSRMIRWALKLSEFNIEWEHRPGVQNVVADLLSRNPVDSVEGSQISCAALRALAINSREQFIREQREDPELGHIYRYLENPDDGSVNATVCEGWSQDFKLINGLLFYAKYFSNLGELRVYIPSSLRKDIMKEFHDLPLARHLGKRKTYLKLRDTCYFPFMRKYIFEYVSTCDRCQKFNYKNALPAGRLMPIVSKYPNEIVTLDLLGPYPASRPERYKFILVISDHFTKWCELIPLRKASAQAIANAFLITI
ncbi:retrovirus-related Pol polyprotein from transposon 297 [Trichonephila clavipes]|nr:retrovirus-related Pol polyprotein from transposon 297 [Trichonephila clavipes]